MMEVSDGGDGGMLEARVVVMTVLIVTQPNVLSYSTAGVVNGQWSVIRKVSP